MQIREYLEQLSRRFAAAELEYGHGTDNPLDEAAYLVYCSLQLDFGVGEEQLQRALSADELQLLETRARQRIESRVPVAYLVGEAWFAGQAFLSDPRALIPRSPIAELIQHRFAGLVTETPARILDLCCGGGCIGIACALAFPAAQVLLADLSSDALQLAAANVERYSLASRVQLLQADLFAGISGRFDLIVCNPPYVADSIVAALAPEYHHEPVLGLRSDDEGLQIPLRILAGAADYLTDSGVLILEVGCAAESLQTRYPRVPFLWLDFEHGGDGVLALTAAQLQQYRAQFI